VSLESLIQSAERVFDQGIKKPIKGTWGAYRTDNYCCVLSAAYYGKTHDYPNANFSSSKVRVVAAEFDIPVEVAMGIFCGWDSNGTENWDSNNRTDDFMNGLNIGTELRKKYDPVECP
jgi:hypothetical protein